MSRISNLGTDVNPLLKLASLALLCQLAADAGADTYRCSQGGKTVISDIPCASGARKVDQAADQISRSQSLEAEVVHQHNRVQLTELEYQAARDRNVRGKVSILPAPTDPEPSSRRRYR